MPIQASSFQAKFAGPYIVEKQFSDQNLISTPNLRKSSRVFHVKLLKQCYVLDVSVASESVSQEVVVVPALTVDSLFSGLDVPKVGLDSERDVEGPDNPIMCGRILQSFGHLEN